ncbi:MAG: hypothetical protein EKK48_19005 [Candidatus Melainabacteria bacterium]|nr:MAG: hypothetical protein EKK48_19005 [Candidatus Melainabacteria bacterium]
MTQSQNALAVTLAVLVAAVLGCIIAIVDLASNQTKLEADNNDIVWSYRQLVFSRYVQALDKTSKYPENIEAHKMVHFVQVTIKQADHLLDDGNIHAALPTLREAGYMTEQVENYLSCGQSYCNN